jgi:adenylate kinase family enzyme
MATPTLGSTMPPRACHREPATESLPPFADLGTQKSAEFQPGGSHRRIRRAAKSPHLSGTGRHHDGVRRMVILGRGGAGKSALSRQLSDVTGIPVVELDALFWQPGPTPMDPSRWAVCQHELVQRDRWILDGDLGPYDTAMAVRLQAADTIVVLDFPFWRCAWRTLRRGREQPEYWRWVWAYRRRSLPDVMRAISSEAPHAKLYVLRNPATVQRFRAEVHQTPNSLR